MQRIAAGVELRATGVDARTARDLLAAAPALPRSAAFVDAERNLAARARHALAHHPVVRTRVPKQESVAAARARAADLFGDELPVVVVGAFFERLQERSNDGLGPDALAKRPHARC